MELALSQLAQTMGLTVPGLDAAGPAAKSGLAMPKSELLANWPLTSGALTKGRGSGEGVSDSGRKAEGRPLGKGGNREEEEGEEGELSEGETATSVIPPKRPESKTRGPTERRGLVQAAPRAAAFTGDVDAESLLRGGGLRKRTTPLTKLPIGAIRTSTSKDDGTRDTGKGRPAPRVACRYFMEGKCSKGDECTFNHAVRPNKTVEEARSEDVCRFHIAGGCLKGDGCMYSHDLSRVPCKFFHAKGECGAGTRCRFSHAPVSEEVRHQLFLEITSVRDPRLPARPSGTSSDQPPLPSSSKTASLQTGGQTDHSWMVPNITLPPAVAQYNPFGSPF